MKRVRRGELRGEGTVKDKNGRLLKKKNVRKRRAEYFKFVEC